MDWEHLSCETKLGHLLAMFVGDALEAQDIEQSEYSDFDCEDLATLSVLGDKLLENQIAFSNLTKQEINVCQRAIIIFQNSSDPRSKQIGNEIHQTFKLIST